MEKQKKIKSKKVSAEKSAESVDNSRNTNDTKDTKGRTAYFVGSMYSGVFIFAMIFALIVYGPDSLSDFKSDKSVLNVAQSQINWTQVGNSEEVLGVQSLDRDSQLVESSHAPQSPHEFFAQIEIVDRFPGYAEVVINVDRLISPVGFDLCIENSDDLMVQSVDCVAPFSCIDSKIEDGVISLEGMVPFEIIENKSNGDIVVATISYNAIRGGSLKTNTSACKSSFFVVGFEQSVLVESERVFGLGN